MKNSKYIEISGVVVHGKGIGKTVGMPTANINFDVNTMNVVEGVYASKVYISDDLNKKNPYIGVTNIGTRPSIDNDKTIVIETNILDFNEEIYGKNMKLILIKKIRDIKKFKNLKEVKEQVDKDKIIAKKIINENNRGQTLTT